MFHYIPDLTPPNQGLPPPLLPPVQHSVELQPAPWLDPPIFHSNLAPPMFPANFTFHAAPRSLADNIRLVPNPLQRRQYHKKAKSLPLSRSSTFVMSPDVHPRSADSHISSIVPGTHVQFPVAPLDLVSGAVPPGELGDLRMHVYPCIVTKKYSAAALDPTRSHLVVYEYPLGEQWVIWDYETGYVHLTGLWRAALQEQAFQRNRNGVVLVKPNAKADIVKLLESTPKALHPYIKRVRGGFLKIQGTWLPYDLCKRLACRFCYYIRFKLVPIFGADFPSQCLLPLDGGFGELRFDDLIDDVNRIARPVLPQISPRLLIDYSRPPQFTGAFSHTTGFSVPLARPLMESRPLVELSPLEEADLAVRPRLSYSDMVDIVNASKCLQRLSQDLQDESGGDLKMKIGNLLS